MDEESATTVALPFLLRVRWRNTAIVLHWAIPVNKDTPPVEARTIIVS